MFCSFCGESCVAFAVFCHKCGKKINAGKKDDSPGLSGIQRTSATTPEQLLSFAAFRARKEEDRAKHFKPSAKKLKTGPEKLEKDVKINIGVLAMKDGNLSVKRGVTLPLSVSPKINSEDLLTKAVDKHNRFNNNLVSSTHPLSYRLLYQDKTEVKTLPGSDEKFVLKRYKEEIDKSYGRITLYLCSVDDYFDNLMYAMASDEEELEKPVLETKPHHTFSGDSDDHLSACSDGKENESRTPLATGADAHLTSSDALNEEVESENERLISCPICRSLYPMQEIEEHADNCSMWLLDDASEQSYDIPGVATTPSNDENTTTHELTSQQHKKALVDQIATLSAQLLSTDTKRLTVRRKFIWLDFKSAMESKIQPKSTLKVVFSGEPAVDEGGPKRELFSELLMIAKEKFFKNGKPMNSTVALNAGDFTTCGKAMGMSVLQGGPAPNFLAPEVASYLVGAPLSPSENQDPLLRTAAERLSSATTDEQVRSALTCDDVLDVLESIGYSGIPQKETVAGIQPIIQSICIKDQLSQYLPQLVQIESGLYECGILSHKRRNTEIWKPVFANGNCFTITADEFLDQMIVNFSESQIRKDAEMNTFKFFSDVMASIDAGGIDGVSVMDLVKWMTGSSQIPPLGFPKKFTVEFVHGCLQGCCCRPTASTCDITMKIPVHIDNEKAMEDMIVSALKDSYGFALI